jgi:hypothetical protein
MSSLLSTSCRETLRLTCAQTVSSGFRCGEYGGKYRGARGFGGAVAGARRIHRRGPIQTRTIVEARVASKSAERRTPEKQST